MGVVESERHCGSQWEAICSVAEKLEPTPETVRKCVRQAEIDSGVGPGCRPMSGSGWRIWSGRIVSFEELTRS